MALERLRDTLVRALATALRANGIDAVLDQWDLSPVPSWLDAYGLPLSAAHRGHEGQRDARRAAGPQVAQP
jgi:hypothetical protein